MIKKFNLIWVLVFLALTSMTLIGCTTMQADQSQVEKIDEIKQFDGLSQDDLYIKSLNWAARTFNSANAVIQLKDKDAGQIICRGYDSIGFIYHRYYSFTMIIDLKDEKARVRFENIVSEQVGNVAGPDMKLQLSSVLKELVKIKESLFLSITDEEEKSNW